MTNKLKLLIKDGLKKKINTKWFKIVNIILLIVIPLIINIDNIIKFFGGDFNEPVNIYVIDNTNEFYNNLSTKYKDMDTLIGSSDIKIQKAKKTKEELTKQIKKEESKDLILEINNDNGIYTASLTSYDYVDSITVTLLTQALNSTKMQLALEESDIDIDELNEINAPIELTRNYLTDELDENYELMSYISGFIIPMFIIPFFLLIIIVTQMIGAEINEEKSSKSMEIIITSVSPKIHFISKIITSNIYAILQSLLFVLYFIIGIFIRGQITGTKITDSFGTELSEMLNTFIKSGMLNEILKCIPWVIIMIILSFIAYSLLAGILASMTTNQEDFQQLQTPLMILIMVGYFIAILASTYEKSTFIIILSVIPFLSSIIAPVLLIIGQIGIMEILIAIFLLLITIYILIKYGSRIYKVGILNYNTNNLWKKMLKSLKTKD